FVQQDFMGQLAVEDLLADFGDALGTERVGSAGPAEGRFLFLIALEEGLFGPLGREGRIGADAVEALKNNPRGFRPVDGDLLGVLDGFGHVWRSPLESVALRAATPWT